MRMLCLAVCALLFQDAGQEAPPAPGQPPPEFPKFEEVVKGLEVKKWENGHFTLYHKENKLLWEVAPDLIGRPFLMATSFARGTYSGWMWDETLVEWRRVDKKLLLVEPNVRHRANQDDPLADSVRRRHTESIVAHVDILTMAPSGGPVIDLFGLLAYNAQAFIGFMASRMDPSLAKIDKVKVFQSNVEVGIDVPSTARMDFWSSGRGQINTVHYSISELRETGFRSRLADDRVGYFLTAVKDYSRSAKDDTRFVRYVNRWQLEKRNPKLKNSPPKEPIIFYIEKTVPVQYRTAVREGILEWNRAFDKVGITGAIEVRQQEADNEFAHYDPEDVRYNFFRWITSDWAFAMGPSRVDPRTGQILDADIIFDDAMIRAYMQDHKVLIGETARSFLSPSKLAFLKARPDRDPLRHELGGDPKRLEQAVAEIEQRASLGLMHGDGRRACSLARGRMQQMAIAQLAGVLAQDADAQDKWPEEFISQIVKETVMHEVGHTLGLRHNFKASSWRPLGDVNGEKAPADTSGSVMDYNPLNLSLDAKKQGRYAPGTIGPYDYWAVEYGYRPLDAGDPEGEKPELMKIGQRVADQGLAYGTDEDLWSSDPHINTWDLGSDPLAYSLDRMKLVQAIQEKLVDRAVKPGDSYAAARRAFMAVLSERLTAAFLAARYVGGHFVHRDHRGDPNERQPLVPVDPAKQREALTFIKDHVFSDQAFKFSPEFLNRLGASRWNHWGGEFDFSVEFPVHDMILAVQRWSLFDLLFPETLQRIMDGELRVAGDKDALTLPELFATLTAAICTEMTAGPKDSVKYTERQPLISSLRRNLQREYVANLITISLEDDNMWGWGYPRTARTLAWHELKKLLEGLDALLAKPPAIDRYSLSHLEEVRQRIKRALDASFSIGGSGDSGVVFGS